MNMNPFKAKSKKEAEAVAAEAAPMTKLEERREELRTKFTELQFDLRHAGDFDAIKLPEKI